MRLTDVSYLLLHQRPFIPKTLLKSFSKKENYHREEAITAFYEYTFHEDSPLIIIIAYE